MSALLMCFLFVIFLGAGISRGRRAGSAEQTIVQREEAGRSGTSGYSGGGHGDQGEDRPARYSRANDRGGRADRGAAREGPESPVHIPR